MIIKIQITDEDEIKQIKYKEILTCDGVDFFINNIISIRWIHDGFEAELDVDEVRPPLLQEYNSLHDTLAIGSV